MAKDKAKNKKLTKTKTDEKEKEFTAPDLPIEGTKKPKDEGRPLAELAAPGQDTRGQATKDVKTEEDPEEEKPAKEDLPDNGLNGSNDSNGLNPPAREIVRGEDVLKIMRAKGVRI